MNYADSTRLIQTDDTILTQTTNPDLRFGMLAPLSKPTDKMV
ncbi:hypothetical protein [Beggiatoa leptomitoformis]|nr:hypothetical protein [Beggiatoa leptomitoformis]